MDKQLAVAFGCTLVLGWGLTWSVRALARRFNLIAVPRPDRWHTKPTALLGGVAIYAAFIIGYLLFAPPLPQVSAILLGGTWLFVLGVIDDLVGLKPYTKLSVQVVVAAVAVYLGLRLPWLWWTGSEALDAFITIFWLVAITNAVNLIDNMDGLAGGLTVIACAVLVASFLLGGQTAEAYLPALLAGAVLGFLFFNFHPASIFMGDCGSMFLGFVLGGTAVLSHYGRTRNVISVLLTPVLVALIPILDTTLVTITRRLSGRPISQGGRDHASHRLVALGMSERRAVLTLYALGAVSGLLVVLLRLLRSEVALWLIPAFAIAILLIGFYLGQIRIYEEGAQPTDQTVITKLVGFAHKRRVLEILLDVALVTLAYYGAYLLRWEGTIPDQQWAIFVRTLPLVIGVHILFFSVFGIYGGLWHFTGVGDLIQIAKSVAVGSSVNAMVILALYQFRGPSRAVLILTGLVLLLLVSASRLSFRLLPRLLGVESSKLNGGKPVLIYGAGNSGDLLIREILNNDEYDYAPVGFIEDDARKIGHFIHGLRIFDSREVPKLVQKYDVREVLVSSSKIPEARLDELRRMGLSPKRLRIQIE
ncbi:MAG: hypothetical protein RMM98_13100 [Acidobacteriota bacterium]|nr:hypothetical protein [Blastocatellia bacterium]MDW8240543.1 hypothetical protein [Acidobacteriota bacterium]